MDNSTVIEAASEADTNAIADLHLAGWRDTYRPALDSRWLDSAAAETQRRQQWTQRLHEPDPSQRVLVARKDGAVAGFVCAYLRADPAWGTYIDNLHVRTDLRGIGIGTALLDSIINQCLIEAPNDPIHLWVLHVNRTAQAFYERLGAKRGDTLTWYAPEGSEVLVYRYHWETDHLPSLAQKVQRRLG